MPWQGSAWDSAFTAKGPGSVLSQDIKIPQAEWHGQKN